MESLYKQLQDLKDQNLLSREEVGNITSSEELLNIALTYVKTVQPSNYDDLYVVFDELREIAQVQYGINIFSEQLTLKFYYLGYLYGIPQIVFDALLVLLGPVFLDFQLDDKYFEDDFAKFYFKRYKEFKQDNESSLMKLLSKTEVKAADLQGEQLNEIVEKIKELMN